MTGTAFWNQLHLSPIRDDDGQVAYFFASQIDVTEYRKVQSLEASEHRLLMEVDHRPKNVLAMVDSFVRLSRSDDPTEYAASVQQRIQALSQAHALLSGKGWKEIPLHDVVEGQLKRYGMRNVNIGGPEVLVSPVGVQPLAMVLHELAANAAVHGALSGANGRLAIAWDRTDETGGFRMTWTENGEKVPVPDRRAGFGTTMVKAIVEKQLSGRLQREWLPHGVEILLEVPPSLPRLVLQPPSDLKSLQPLGQLTSRCYEASTDGEQDEDEAGRSSGRGTRAGRRAAGI
jgi:two-component sensor histidine kinase